MIPRNDLKHSKTYLIIAQITVLFLAMSLLFWLMLLGNKERIVNDLMARLDVATQAMAEQLKANQVPFSIANVEPGVFIINQSDGAVAVDRRSEDNGRHKLWERYKTKIIYEMQKQKRGWIEYPDKDSWVLNEPRRIIRYLSIDELNWILAVEELKPSSLELFKDTVSPSTCLMIIFIFFFGSGFLWFMTEKYFDLIRRQISDHVEDNFLSLNGEDKVWGKSHGNIPKINEGTKEGGLEFQIPKTNNIPQVVEPALMNVVSEIPKASVVKSEEAKEQTVDVGQINSLVLKKMLQKFREK